MADGRPFRAEYWYWDGIVGYTYIFSVKDLESAEREEVLSLFRASGLLDKVTPKMIYYSGGLSQLSDAQGELMWFYSFTIGLAARIIYLVNDEQKMAFFPEDDDIEPFAPFWNGGVVFSPGIVFLDSSKACLDFIDREKGRFADEGPPDDVVKNG